MTQQKALVIPEMNADFQVAEVPILKPNNGEILVKVYSTALNPADWLIQKQGQRYAAIVKQYPAILGLEGAGVVEEVGEGVTAFQMGDKVFLQGEFGGRYGTFRQYTTIPADLVAKLPDNLSFDQAASIPMGLITSAIGLYLPHEKKGADLQAPWDGGEGKYADQSFVVFGGASSVGQSAIQLAKLSGFSKIITTCSPHNADLVKSLGATHVIDRKADVVAEALKVLSEPPKVIYDAVGIEITQTQAIQILAPNGTLLLVAPPIEAVQSAPGNKKAYMVLGSAHLHRELGVKLFANLKEYVEAGKIKPNRIEVVPKGLAGIPTALERLEKNQVSGIKLIARPQEID